jgi:hypothetical protein
MAYEDFTTYTENDPLGVVTITASKVSWTNMTRNDDFYTYKDYGANHFDGDFEHLCTIYDDNQPSGVSQGLWMVSTITGNLKAIYDASGGCLNFKFYNGPTAELQELRGGSWTTDSGNVSIDTLYYPKIKRDEAVGANGTLYAYVYTDSSRTNLHDTLSISLTAKTDFRYLQVAWSYDDNYGPTGGVAYVENLDLQEVVAGSSWRDIMQIIAQKSGIISSPNLIIK